MSARDNRVSAVDFDRRLSYLVVATADESDLQIDRAVNEVLRLVRDHLQMDVAFVSQFEGGRRVFRYIEQGEGDPLLAVGASDPLEQSFCQRVIDGRLPQLVQDVARLPDFRELPATSFPIGAHMSTPIVLRDGAIYGTLCCFSFAPNESLASRDLGRLRMAAAMAARLIDKASGRGIR
ncbi:MAG: GAF domain-containing protein [Variovorax sp.]|jgi:hypothetical protein|nr:MAG: GAF domain-containing protein [Variovorax sp.]